MILLSSAEAPADFSDKNRNNSKNANISTRASNDNHSIFFSFPFPLSSVRCLSYLSPYFPVEQKGVYGWRRELVNCWRFSKFMICVNIVFVGFIFSYENHHWTGCSYMVFTCGVVLGRKPQGISWMRRPNPARPLSLWCILLLFLRLRKLHSMILCGLRYHIPAHATRLGFAHGSLLCCWTWTTRIFHPRAGLLEDFLVH